jgi:hypothetical protein
MHEIKGSDLAVLKTILREKGRGLEETFLSHLTTEQAGLYHSVRHTSWLPAEPTQPLYEAAIRVLFPGAMDGAYKLGRLLADRSYSTLYRIVISIPSVSFVMRRAAAVWSSHHGMGEASTKQTSPKSAVMIVTGAPEMPKFLLNLVRGHIAVLTEITGGKNVRVNVDADDPQNWQWNIFWE